jgi:hypothetical protein
MTRIQLTGTVNVFYMMRCAWATDIAEVESTEKRQPRGTVPAWRACAEREFRRAIVSAALAFRAFFALSHYFRRLLGISFRL